MLSVPCHEGRARAPSLASSKDAFRSNFKVPCKPHRARSSAGPQRKSTLLKQRQGVRLAVHDEVHETKLSKEVLAGIKGLKEEVKWSHATITRNDAANLAGTIRLLHLNIADQMDVLYGRKVKGVVDSRRWIDKYQHPGQSVAIRLPPSPGAPAAPAGPCLLPCLHHLASSPYEAKRDSAYLSSSVVEIVVEKGCSAEEDRLADMGPGSEIEVSQALGRGFTSLFSTTAACGLSSAIEAQRPLLMVGVGSRGLAALRACLNSIPLQAHATRQPVACIAITSSPREAAFVTQWDTWRGYGFKFEVHYTDEGRSAEGTGGQGRAPGPACLGSGGLLSAARVAEVMERALFVREGGFDGMVGRARDCSVLLAGLAGAGEAASLLTKRLSQRGVGHEHMLFCDHF